MKYLTRMQPDWRWAIIPLALAFAPFVFFEDQAYITVSDGLECEFIALDLLKKNNALFFESNAIIDEPMGGIRSDNFHSAINFNRIVFWLLPSINAYGFLTLFYRILGLWGAWLLLKEFAIRRKKQLGWSAVLLALGFSTIHSINLYGLSSLGLPLLTACLLRLLRSTSEKWCWLIFIFFGFFSHLAMTLIAVTCIWGVALLLKLWRRDEKGVRTIISSGCALIFGMLLVNYQTVNGFLVPGEIMHRVERNVVANFLSGWGWTKYTLFHGHYHSGTFPGLFTLISGVLLALISAYFKSNRKLILPVFAYLFVGVLFQFAKPFTSMADIRFFHQFDLQRVHFLLPILALIIGANFMNFGRFISTMWATTWLTLCLYGNPEIKSNWKQFILDRGTEVMYFDRLVATNDWQKLLDELDIGNSRVGMSGIPSWTVQYNGVRTIGGYQNMYPLAYKHKFRKVLAPEFLKSPRMKNSFDHWGNKCHLFSAQYFEKGFSDQIAKWEVEGPLSNVEVSWDIAAIKKLNCKYIFSSIPLVHEKQEQFDLITTSAMPLWNVYVYEISSNENSF